MEIQTASLPSHGYKAQLPPAFTMRRFGGKENRAIAKAIDKKDMKYILLDALAPCLSIPLDELTVPDAYALVFQQRMWMNSVMPLMTHWRCNKPLFEYSDGIVNEMRPEGGAINTFPCAANNVGIVDETSMTVAVLAAEHETFDLPRMRHFERASEDMFSWHVAHMGRNFDANVALLEEQEDLKLWLQLSEWVLASRHGVLTDISLECPACKRKSVRAWDMNPSMFVR
ncbi:hypothetical protein pEaSNUABM28_00137 [Erwinia phage pEa_SNUABM_28]|uniref:Uncharacterized protein n=1 Tax=Erwinia phage pEa_SNUABM_16 TaxID=2869544 RepID=A0AAE9BU90_9CAUD|nr:hypothetical protein MPK64_gp135 [Erwinia phage pEa_SNUABM_16]QZE58694.1 hypothetical protein pEaSNUABM28_00137 [Erwinia phage pEa_SNUABM_28]QZE59038.1 hypothetical protein pEaSNUABM18_00135 [Erwinia phage pEa_SNUABM_18]UAW96279.1 hypothetical protein pEaSNUABM16_00135 [Erwinia phage pEa_SNUABM_16]